MEERPQNTRAQATPHAKPARRLVSALSAVLALSALAGTAACGSGPATDRAAASSPAPAGSPPVSVKKSPAPPANPSAAELPAPGVAIPANPAKLAAALRETSTALNKAIDAWAKNGKPPRTGPPEDVELLALHHQRIHRFAARHPKVATHAFARLPAGLAAHAKDNTAAIRELLSLARPIKGSAPFKVGAPLPAGELLAHFKKAERRFKVEWEVLAAVMLAETKFGRVRSASHVGAQGPMQFMPATWKLYGMGGDIKDPEDAIMAAANYLRATGAPRDYQRALHAYNPAQAYVDAILLHARQIKRDPRNYYLFYNWQVYVITTTGERRLTGP